MTSFAAELRIGQATAPPGTVVSVPVTCADASGAVAAQFDVSFNPSVVSLAGISAGDGLAGHVVDRQELAPGRWRVLVYSTANNAIAPGAVVWVSFTIPTTAPDGVVPLGMTNAIVASVSAHRVQPLAQVGGALTIQTGPVEFRNFALGSEGQIHVTLIGRAGQNYTIEQSTDLNQWEVVTNLTSASGTIEILLLIQPEEGLLFFRAKQ